MKYILMATCAVMLSGCAGEVYKYRPESDNRWHDWMDCAHEAKATIPKPDIDGGAVVSGVLGGAIGGLAYGVATSGQETPQHIYNAKVMAYIKPCMETKGYTKVSE